MKHIMGYLSAAAVLTFLFANCGHEKSQSPVLSEREPAPSFLQGAVLDCIFPDGSLRKCLIEYSSGPALTSQSQALLFENEEGQIKFVNVNVKISESSLTIVSAHFYPSSGVSYHVFFEGRLEKGVVLSDTGTRAESFALSPGPHGEKTCQLGSSSSGDSQGDKTIKTRGAAECAAIRKGVQELMTRRGWTSLRGASVRTVLPVSTESTSTDPDVNGLEGSAKVFDVTYSYNFPYKNSEVHRARISSTRQGGTGWFNASVLELTPLFPASLISADQRGQPELAVSQHLSAICGDTFCAGDLDWSDMTLRCRPETCTFGATVRAYFHGSGPIADFLRGSLPLPYETPRVKLLEQVNLPNGRQGLKLSCSLPEVSAEDLKTNPETRNDTFYKAVRDLCVPEVERILLGP